jgi:hypothetical protein
MGEVAKLPEAEDEDFVDLDLDADDQLLREAVGQPIRVKVGGQVIEVPHPQDWPHTANTAASNAEFGAWAAQVLSDEDYKVFQGANLRNYQVNALFEHVNKRAGVSPGKSPSSARSSRSKPRR